MPNSAISGQMGLERCDGAWSLQARLDKATKGKVTIPPALRVIKTKPGTKVVSSFFIMEVPNEAYGDDGLMLFSDCAVCIQPNAEELSEIAVASARSFKDLTGAEPRVAMLSHATKGSVIDDDAAKVVEATRLAREKAPGFLIDGELQADAAIVQSVGASKAPDSSVAGRANVLVFPDLDAANIGYKLVQRLGYRRSILQHHVDSAHDVPRGHLAAGGINRNPLALKQRFQLPELREVTQRACSRNLAAAASGRRCVVQRVARATRTACIDNHEVRMLKLRLPAVELQLAA